MKKITKGFTLIELLLTVGIVGVVGGMVAVILFTTLQGASKADVMREVKQNGDYALNIMERMTRNAAAIASSCDGSSQTSMSLTNLDGETTLFSLSGGQIASNSGKLTNTKVTVTNLSFTCSRAAGQPDVVAIGFVISQAGGAVRPEEKATMTFQTTVSLRTY